MSEPIYRLDDLNGLLIVVLLLFSSQLRGYFRRGGKLRKC